MFPSYKEGLIMRARELRRNMTKQERHLWYDFLRNHPSKKFYRQRPIGRYIADFYCEEVNLVIEIDGSQHGTDESIEYDNERTKYMNSVGIRVVRFLNDEVDNNFENVCDEINKLLS